jgi:hypothetical protein
MKATTEMTVLYWHCIFIWLNCLGTPYVCSNELLLGSVFTLPTLLIATTCYFTYALPWKGNLQLNPADVIIGLVSHFVTGYQ